MISKKVPFGELDSKSRWNVKLRYLPTVGSAAFPDSAFSVCTEKPRASTCLVSNRFPITVSTAPLATRSSDYRARTTILARTAPRLATWPLTEPFQNGRRAGGNRLKSSMISKHSRCKPHDECPKFWRDAGIARIVTAVRPSER